MKGGENLGDEESSKEEKEVTRLDSSAGSKVTCFRRYFLALHTHAHYCREDATQVVARESCCD